MAAGDQIPDRALVSALEFAVGIAAAGAKLRPALAFPSELKPFLKFTRLPARALADVRRAVDADDEFRGRLAKVAVPDLVDEAGMLWLVRPDGWREQIAELVGEPDAADLAVELRRAERRREAAEQTTHRALAELTALRAELDRRDQVVSGAADELTELRRERDLLVEAGRAHRDEVRRARDRLAAATGRLGRLEEELAEAHRRLGEAEGLRDELLAARAAASPIAAVASDESVLAGAGEVAGALAGRSRSVRDLATELEQLAERLAALEPVTRRSGAVEPRPARPARPPRSTRRPVGLPGGVYGSSGAAAEFLVRHPGIVALVDGYNVAKLAWPLLDLEVQRERCVAACEDVARRFGTDVTVVFDGTTIAGAAVSGRRLVRVTFSPEGVLADDVLRDEVASRPSEVAVLVVTNDQAVLTDVRAMGANTITSEQWLALAGR